MAVAHGGQIVVFGVRPRSSSREELPDGGEFVDLG